VTKFASIMMEATNVDADLGISSPMMTLLVWISMSVPQETEIVAKFAITLKVPTLVGK